MNSQGIRALHDLDPRLNVLSQRLIDAAVDGDEQLFFSLRREEPGLELVRITAGSRDRTETFTPLVCAIMGNVPAIIRAVLADQGVSHEAEQMESRRRAIHVAVTRGSFESVALLVAAGVNLSPLARGWTPLHLLAEEDSTVTWNDGARIVALFATAGADIDAPGRDGLTPLMVACAKGRRDLIEALLVAGADPSLIDEAGRRAIDHLEAAGREGWSEQDARAAEVRAALTGEALLAPA